MRDAEKIKNFIKSQKVSVHPGADERMLGNALKQLTAHKQTDRESVWRKIMANRITKFAAAAAVLIIFLLTYATISKFKNANELITETSVCHILPGTQQFTFNQNISPEYILSGKDSDNLKEVQPCYVLPHETN